MRHTHYTPYLHIPLVLLLGTVAGLWAWNVLTELFNGPHAHYRHALAAMVLLVIVKSVFTRHGHHSNGRSTLHKPRHEGVGE